MDQCKELTATQSCRRLGISLDALYRLIYAAKLPGRKVEGAWLIPAVAVEERFKARQAQRGKTA